MATEISALRRFRCALCGVLALVCRFCDRGQIYCAHECSQIARRESLRRASVRHQASREGRRNHAARQTHYRESRRELQIVQLEGESYRLKESRERADTRQSCRASLKRKKP